MTESRERIIEAAREEFSRLGYRSSSTNRIVAGAGVSKGLLFSYFGSKEELFLSLLIDELSRFVSTVAAEKLEGGDPISRFEQMIRATFRYYNEQRTGFALMMTTTEIDRPLVDELLRRLAAAELPDLLDRVVDGADYSRLAVSRAELRRVLGLVLNGVKQTIAVNIRAQSSAADLERIFYAELAILTRVLREGIFRGGDR